MRKSVKNFIASLIVVSLLTALFPRLSQWISLSAKSFFPTELITFPFASKEGFSFGLIFDLFFSCFFLSFALSTLLMRHSLKQVLILFGSASLFIGLTTVGALAITGSAFTLAGPAPLIYCLLIALLASDQNLKLLLFGLLPVEPRILIAVLLGLNVIHNLSVGAYFQIAADLSGVVYAWIYAQIAFKKSFSFPLPRRRASSRSDKIIEIHDWTSSDSERRS